MPAKKTPQNEKSQDAQQKIQKKLAAPLFPKPTKNFYTGMYNLSTKYFEYSPKIRYFVSFLRMVFNVLWIAFRQVQHALHLVRFASYLVTGIFSGITNLITGNQYSREVTAYRNSQLHALNTTKHLSDKDQISIFSFLSLSSIFLSKPRRISAWAIYEHILNLSTKEALTINISEANQATFRKKMSSAPLGLINRIKTINSAFKKATFAPLPKSFSSAAWAVLTTRPLRLIAWPVMLIVLSALSFLSVTARYTAKVLSGIVLTLTTIPAAIASLPLYSRDLFRKLKAKKIPEAPQAVDSFNVESTANILSLLSTNSKDFDKDIPVKPIPTVQKLWSKDVPKNDLSTLPDLDVVKEAFASA